MNTTRTVYLDNTGTIGTPLPRRAVIYKCPGCDRTFPKKRGLSQHLAYLHRFLNAQERPLAARKGEG